MNTMRLWQLRSRQLTDVIVGCDRPLHASVADLGSVRGINPHQNHQSGYFWLLMDFIVYTFPEILAVMRYPQTILRDSYRSEREFLQLCRNLPIRPRQFSQNGVGLGSLWNMGQRLFTPLRWDDSLVKFQRSLIRATQDVRWGHRREVWLPDTLQAKWKEMALPNFTLAALEELTAYAIQEELDWFTLRLLRAYWHWHKVSNIYEHVPEFEQWAEAKGLPVASWERTEDGKLRLQRNKILIEGKRVMLFHLYKKFLQEDKYPRLMLWGRLSPEHLESPYLEKGLIVTPGVSLRGDFRNFKRWLEDDFEKSGDCFRPLTDLAPLNPYLEDARFSPEDRESDAEVVRELLEVQAEKKRLEGEILQLKQRMGQLVRQRSELLNLRVGARYKS